jgi:hypothetical protein
MYGKGKKRVQWNGQELDKVRWGNIRHRGAKKVEEEGKAG